MRKALASSTPSQCVPARSISEQFNPDTYIKLAGDYLSSLELLARTVDRPAFGETAYRIADTILSGNTVFVAGNGGSASTASHVVCDIVCTCAAAGIRPARVVGLADNPSVLSALANDIGYDEVFSRQVDLLGNSGDLLLILSVSGSSKNILRAAHVARKRGVTIAAALGLPNTTLERMADYVVVMNSSDYGLVEDLTLSLNHLVARILNGNSPRRCTVESQ